MDYTTLSPALANQADVRERVASRGLTKHVEEAASLAVGCGYTSWSAAQNAADLEAAGLYGISGPELSKALLRG